MLRDQVPYKEIQKRLNMSERMLRHIKLGKAWKTVNPDVSYPEKCPRR